jgi:hypothetical protein
VEEREKKPGELLEKDGVPLKRIEKDEAGRAPFPHKYPPEPLWLDVIHYHHPLAVSIIKPGTFLTRKAFFLPLIPFPNFFSFHLRATI